MAMINGTNFKGNGKFHKWLVRAIALRPLILIGFSLGTVITAPALALEPPDWCIPTWELPGCPGGFGGGGGGGFEFPPAEPNPKPPYDPDDPKPKPPKPKPKPSKPKPQPPSQPKPDPYVCTKKPDLPQCN